MNIAKKKNIRTIFVGAAVLAAPLLFFLLVPPFGQDPSYHRFADTRPFLQTPNFLNVLSNTAFVAVGCYGLVLLGRKKLVHDNTSGFPAYALFFLGLTLTGFGSGYYHLAPDNATLTWDRLPMTIAFTALTVAVLSEHVRRGIERWILYPLLALGLFSVWYWQHTEQLGHGDLRMYVIFQFLPMILIPAVCVLFRSRFTRQSDLYAVLGFYVLAKVAEHFDAAIFGLTGSISGHSLKHLFAAMGAYWVARMLLKRTKTRSAIA